MVIASHELQNLEAIQMSAEEFIALPESPYPTELIGGILMVRGVPLIVHQTTIRKLLRWLESVLMDKGFLGIAPVSVQFDETHFYQPDVLWVAPDNPRCQIRVDGIIGAPDLVIEVLSPGTAVQDRGIKFRIYEQYHVREYWIADPELETLEIWTHTGDFFRQHGLATKNDTITSPLLQHALPLGMIFGELHPTNKP